MRAFVKCLVESCEKEKQGRGYCQLHYKRLRRTGDPLIARLPHIPKLCVVYNCSRIGQQYGYCRQHYQRIPNNYIDTVYSNMLKRVNGTNAHSKKYPHLYLNKPILPKTEFKEWAIESNEFHSLFRQWVESDYAPALAPSIDRIDSNFGYSLFNMQWITIQENRLRGLSNRWKDHVAKRPKSKRKQAA